MIDLSLISESLPFLLKGALLTLQIAIIACFFGFCGGILLGIIYSFNNKFIISFADLYVSIIRGTPMLVQIIIIFYALPQLGISISPIWSAIFALGMNSSAYVSQIIRSGISSVSIGQIEAGKTLGLNNIQIFFSIILPQAIRVVMPSLGNELVTLVKDTSLASIIGVMELSKQGAIIRSRTYDAFSILLAVAIIYLCLTSILTYFLKILQTKLAVNVRDSRNKQKV